MDQLYSLTLLISFTCGGAALAAGLLGRLQSQPVSTSARLVVPAAVGAWIALLVSFSVHVWCGHTPGSLQALPPLEFLREHLSFVVAAIIPVVALFTRPHDARQSSLR